jgi:hypothetical protein
MADGLDKISSGGFALHGRFANAVFDQAVAFNFDAAVNLFHSVRASCFR